MPWFKDDYQKYFPSLTWQAREQIPRVLASAGPEDVVVDLGAGGRVLSETTLCVDFIPFPNTDLVGDCECLPLRDDSVDLIIGTGLLEHVGDHRAVLEEVARVLRPGGRAHMEMPFLQQYHDDPIDNRRLTVPGLEREMERVGLRTEVSGVHIGPTVTMITLFTYYVALVFEGKPKFLRAISTGAFLLSSILMWPAKFLDHFLIDKRSAHRLAFGIYCTARKPEAASASNG